MAKLEGLPVIDADHGLELHVEKRDVDRRAKKDPSRCALATCAGRTLATEARVFMSRAYVMARDGTHWIRYVVGDSAQREITAFDRGAAFEPGTYRLSPPAPAQKLGYQKPSGSRSSKSTGKIVRPHHVTANVRQRAPVGGIQK